MRMRKEIIAATLALGMTFSISAYSEESTKSGQTMLDEAGRAVTHVEGVISQGQEMLKQAQADSDVARMDCLNAQLINAKGFLNVVQNGEANLRDAVARDDTAAQQHHYKLVQLAVSKSDALSARMAECSTGVVGSISGETRQETKRECTIEPCLSGEEYYQPSIENEVSIMAESSVDSSPYM